MMVSVLQKKKTRAIQKAREVKIRQQTFNEDKTPSRQKGNGMTREEKTVQHTT